MDTALLLAGDPGAWAALATLIAMEVVLGLDNLVFIALLSNSIAERRRGLARSLGLSLVLVFRLALLASADGTAGHGFRARTRPHRPTRAGRATGCATRSPPRLLLGPVLS